jgi:hypothetical protein
MNDQSSQPADPAGAAAIAKVKRLMLWTMAATFIALALVLMVIGYRFFRTGESAPPVAADQVLSLPPGARVLSSSVSADTVAVTVETAGSTQILMFDRKTLKPAGHIQLKPAP